MKKITLLITLLILTSFTVGVLAQETELPDPGLAPDSYFYFLERITEAIGTFFTFGDLKKAERYASLATERLAEAKDMADKDKPELVEKTLKRYEMQLNKSMVRAEKAMNKGKDFEKVMEAIVKAGKTTFVHVGVLTEIYEKVPEQAKTAVENAMKVSVKRHEKAVEALKSSNYLGEIPEKASISTKIPQEVRERIQRKAQEELMVEKAFQGTESPRELCVKAGGPSEMCEKIPVDGFESFEALKIFFVGVGAPPEAWTIVEARCKELGAITPDKCFRLLLISSSEAYSSAELKTVPAPSLSEEEMEERRRREEENRTLKIETPEGTIEISTKELEEGIIKIPGKEGTIEIHRVELEGEE